MISVVVAAHSAQFRDDIARIVGLQADLSVAAVAASGGEALRAVARQKPGIVILGADLLVREGIDSVEQIMIEVPTPIAVVTDGLDPGQVELSMRALRSGALTVLQLPPAAERKNVNQAVVRFISDVRASAEVKVVRRWRRVAPAPQAESVSKQTPTVPRKGAVVGIAASTGGPAALQRVLSSLSADFAAPILVVQHITPGFTEGFVRWLQGTCRLTIKMAASGEPVLPGNVYMANDGRHLGFAGAARLLLSDAPPRGGFKPSASYLFESIAAEFGSQGIGVILTGMGTDGAEGLAKLRQSGGHVIAQDESSSIVFGMPAAAIKAGIVHDVLPLEGIAARLVELVH